MALPHYGLRAMEPQRAFACPTPAGLLRRACKGTLRLHYAAAQHAALLLLLGTLPTCLRLQRCQVGLGDRVLLLSFVLASLFVFGGQDGRGQCSGEASTYPRHLPAH